MMGLLGLDVPTLIALGDRVPVVDFNTLDLSGEFHRWGDDSIQKKTLRPW